MRPFVHTVRYSCFHWSTRCSLDHSQIMLENMIIRFYTNLWFLCSLSAAAIKVKGGKPQILRNLNCHTNDADNIRKKSICSGLKLLDITVCVWVFYRPLRGHVCLDMYDQTSLCKQIVWCNCKKWKLTEQWALKPIHYRRERERALQSRSDFCVT